MTKITSLALLLILTCCISKGQLTLVREGITINNTVTGTWYGDVISRSNPTNLTYQNNSITSVNTGGYMLLAGDETPGSNNNNLDGAKFLGNKFVWKGVNGTSVITHGLFTGYNKNLTVKYNYLENVPYGIIFKSGTDDGKNMTFTSGGCAYNICKNGKFSVRLKGMNGVKMYNNTFYSGDNAGLYLVLITSNSDRTVPAPSLGAEIYNNIFYSTSKIPMISIEQESLANFSCDYNVYWCTAGEPVFMVSGRTYSWAQWQAMGYDQHSKILDPSFNNTTEFIPANRLDFGKDLGSDWQTGLATSAKWIAGTSPSTTNQSGKWQVGAVLYKSSVSVSQISISSTNGSTSINTKNGTLQLNALVTPTDASDKSVTWSIANGTNSATVNTSGIVSALATGNVTVRATANDGSGVYSEFNITISIPTNAAEPYALAEFKIYPNPASGVFFIEFNDIPTSGILVEIIDLSGKILESRQIFSSPHEWQLNPHLRGGIYLVKAIGEAFSSTKRLIAVSENK